MYFLSKSGIAGCNGSCFGNFFEEVPYCVFIVTASVYILCGVFEGYMNPKTVLKPSLTQVALLGKWWTMGSKVWTLMYLSLLFLWSSDSKMSTALSVVMHFPRSLRKQKNKSEKNTHIFSRSPEAGQENKAEGSPHFSPFWRYRGNSFIKLIQE